MSAINSLGNTIIKSSTASSARLTDAEHNQVTGARVGLEGFQSKGSAIPFSLGNPGFGNRAAGGSFSVSQFLG